MSNVWGIGPALLLAAALLSIAAGPEVQSPRPPLSYDIVYVRAPRAGDGKIVDIPEVATPVHMVPGSDLMLLHPDGTEEVLVPGGSGAIVDPAVSFDAEWVYYSRFHDMRPEALNIQRERAPLKGADIYKIHLRSREVFRLTFQEWTPNTGAAEWATNDFDTKASGPYRLGYGIFNLGATPLPGGRLMFTSSRNGFRPTKPFTYPNLQLFVMDDDGKNVETIGFMNLGSALHPSILSDGRVMFSSYESEGMRDARAWALWSIWPDGRNWGPLMSAFKKAQAFHGHAELSNHHIVVTSYYNLNNNGFGTLLAFPPSAPPGVPAFGRARPDDPSNPPVHEGLRGRQFAFTRYPFSPSGLYALTRFSHGRDESAFRLADGAFAGKTMHPAGAPQNDLLVVWSPGPANHLNRPTWRPAYDAGLYLLPGGSPIDSPGGLVLLRNDPAYNELWPKPVVPYKSIYGIDQPPDLTRRPSPSSPLLPPDAPFGLVGTSTFLRRDTAPGVGPAGRLRALDPFNTAENETSSNWYTQGADAGLYTDDDIFAVRILAMEPTSHRSYGPIQAPVFKNVANERLRILGEIALRKTDRFGKPVRDINNQPDTSFLARIPADTPFTFQTLDRDGLVLNMSQTWHQLRPGESRTDCGGCHAHSQQPTAFEQTAAARSDYQVADLTTSTPMLSRSSAGSSIVGRPYGPVDVEYYRDIKPLLKRSCAPCHSSKGRQEARLALDDETVPGEFEGTYNRLANDPTGSNGIPSVLPNRSWRGPNLSRYIRAFQSRRSLLVWKVFGRRLDGWTNADFPTESVPGDPTTLPPGARFNDADIDFTGTICPPPDAGVPPLTPDEQLTFARWVDLGAPITSPRPGLKGRGWFQDDLRPTLTLSVPAHPDADTYLSEIRIGAFDYYSGLEPGSLSVKASFAINRYPAGTEISRQFTLGAASTWRLAVSPPVLIPRQASITVSVRDLAGNMTRIERSISTRVPHR